MEKVKIILWDYDGTLVNSAKKNIEITKKILLHLKPDVYAHQIPACLLDEKLYQEANHSAKNWIDLYQNYLLLTQEEALQAGSLWKSYQENEQTPVTLFDGLANVISSVSHARHGICSQNSKTNIVKTLNKFEILNYFTCIIGYDDLPSDRQKPDPAPGILCLSDFPSEIGKADIFYVGDHESDVIFADNLQNVLKQRVYAVSVTYSGGEPHKWGAKPDYIANTPSTLLNILNNEP